MTAAAHDVIISNMSTVHLTVLSGASRGLGRAIAEQVLLQPGKQRLLCISRKPDSSLDALAREAAAELDQWTADLIDAKPAAGQLHEWLRQFDDETFDTVTLVNNAGTVASLRRLGDSDGGDVINALRVGLEAPMMLTAAFLSGTSAWRAQRRVLNVSSSAGRKPVSGQAPYCAAKAGMDHYTRVVALEQSVVPNGARLVSIAPGNMDTDMQHQLRNSDPAQFPDGPRFVRFKAEGRLQHPAAVAEKMLGLLARKDFGDDPVVYLHDAWGGAAVEAPPTIF